MSVLSVYKASAGSGKTFKLTSEYLKLLFKNQGNFSNILAVTFTNKATAEMRERILKELHTISKGEKSDHVADILKVCPYSNSELPQVAKDILQRILHNYSSFNISTIDSFFQRILKAFTREIGLNVGFNIELNPKPIIEKAVDTLFEDISDDPSLEEWLGEYAFHKVKDGKSWDIYKDLIEFTNSGFSEVFFSFDEEHLTELLNLENFKKLNVELKKIINSFLKTVHTTCDEFEQIVQQNGLTIDDFSSKKSGVAGYFLNKVKSCTASGFAMPGANVNKAVNSVDGITGWVTKTSPNRDVIQGVVTSKLQNLVSDYSQFVEANAVSFYSAIAVQRNLNVFAVLVEIFKRVLEYCNDNNLFLLPLASPFLAKLIEDDDAPFIYEKTGEYLNHFMIDEFQDTSQLQWRNFSPLVLNAISQNNSSLVVGDIKQSIYRWRNSDWSLLDRGLVNQFRNFNVKEESLTYNWRSCKNVINFNNWCFNQLSSMVQDDINADLEDATENDDEVVKRVYAESAQKVPDNNSDTTGYIEAKFFSDDYEQATLEHLTSTILQLHEKGYQPKDIAVLVRRNVEGAQVAKHLMEQQKLHPEKEKIFRFVSSDSVFLGSSEPILLIIALLNYLNSGSKINKTSVLYFYQTLCFDSDKAVKLISETDIETDEQFLQLLPPDFGYKRDEFKRMSLVELTNRLIKIFLLNNEENKQIAKTSLPFIQTFQDIVLNYASSNGNGIDGFIEWWNEKGNETPVNLSDEQNAIRIITIHKSKGLEFKAVIMPYVSWKFEPQSALLWCHSNEEPYKDFRLLPINYSSALKTSYFSDYYKEEQIKSVVDNLNLLYVAFTRAEKALFISAPASQTKKGNKHSTIAHALYSLLNNNVNYVNLDVDEKDYDENELMFSCGEIPINEQEQLKPDDELPVDYVFGDFHNKLKIRLQGKEIAELNDEAELTPRVKGSIYHKIFEFIKHKDDAVDAVNRVLRMGLINNDELEQYINEINSFLQSDSCYSWFNNSWRVYNERSIMLKDGTIYRPDRLIENGEELIIIDYKFSKQLQEKYTKQVGNYMEGLSSLTSKKVKGFVWYVSLNKSVEV